MWTTVTTTPFSRSAPFRHDTSQDEIRFDWIRHDGKRFGIEHLQDPSYGININASFIVPEPTVLSCSLSTSPSCPSSDPNPSNPIWIQHITALVGTPPTDNTANTRRSLVFYLGNADSSLPVQSDGGYLHIDSLSSTAHSAESTVVNISGHSRASGAFRLLLHLKHDLLSTPAVTYWGLSQQDVTRGVERVRGVTTLPNSLEEDSNFAAVQVQFADHLIMRALFFEHLETLTSPNTVSNTIVSLDVSTVPEEEAETAWLHNERDPADWVRRFDLLLHSLLHYYQQQFEIRFHRLFPSTSTHLSPQHLEIARRAVSGTNGGLGYFTGRPRVAGWVDDVAVLHPVKGLMLQTHPTTATASEEGPLLTLLTATPSRTSFPRGFLWDEGFHQLLISEWDWTISLQVLRDWLQCMHFPACPEGAVVSSQCSSDDVSGWIPREMILGEEATRRVPDEFVTQRGNVANPPTLLLVVQALQRRFFGTQESVQDSVKDSVDSVGEKQEVLRFLQEVFPRLHVWLQWFLTSQKSDFNATSTGAFRWKGRSVRDGKVVPNTLSSGLDDYPRATVPTADEHHVDLHAWMARSARIMADLQELLAGQSPVHSPVLPSYRQLASSLTSSLQQLHWSDRHRGFFDVGMHNDSSFFLLEVFFRCAADEGKAPGGPAVVDVAVPLELVQSGRGFCPPSHPTVLFPHGDGHGNYKQRERFVHPGNLSLEHIPRVGYVSLFPFLLQLLDPLESPQQLEHVLDMLESPDLLWSEHGLRSLARTDKFYRKMNAPGDEPYWRGPIWVNVNYLALSALHHYKALLLVTCCQHGSEEKGNKVARKKLQQRVEALYGRLRGNVLRTVLGEFVRTGQFWEHYDDVSGLGMRGHPFTGWTALVVNILADKY